MTDAMHTDDIDTAYEEYAGFIDDVDAAKLLYRQARRDARLFRAQLLDGSENSKVRKMNGEQTMIDIDGGVATVVT